MSKLNLTEQHTSQRAGFADRTPISTFRDDTRNRADHHVFYVHGFGIVGTIVTNARRIQSSRPSDGYSGSADVVPLALAERPS
jgi:hypothetical protein